jgi:hypothetical protein
MPPLKQAQDYYTFADRRSFFGLTNCMDVVTSLAFLPVGLAGLWVCFRRNHGAAQLSWAVFFLGLTAVSLGSAYFHQQPEDATLVWDRLPMTLAFMGLLVAVLTEHLGERFRLWLAPACLIGMGSVWYWAASSDLRPYALVQYIPFLIVPAAMLLYPGNFTHRIWLLATFAGYVLAKLSELFDSQIFAATHRLLSGHSLKHLLAALGCIGVIHMLRCRRRLGGAVGGGPPSGVSTPF